LSQVATYSIFTNFSFQFRTSPALILGCLFASPLKKEIQLYDQLGSSSRHKRYLQSIFWLIKDHYNQNNTSYVPNWEKLCLIGNITTTPSQENGFNCGVFLLLFLFFLSNDGQLACSQNEINRSRVEIARSILDGRILGVSL
jgi:Ulp1 family protease